jgi:hypothetical protein
VPTKEGRGYHAGLSVEDSSCLGRFATERGAVGFSPGTTHALQKDSGIAADPLQASCTPTTFMALDSYDSKI